MGIPVIIDTDPGVDDALALLLALASPEVEIEAVTIVAGNVGVELGARNALLTLEASGVADPPPVAVGCNRPISGEPVEAKHVHGEDGLGGAAAKFPAPRLKPVDAPASRVLLETARRRPGELTVVALGPLTNIARAIGEDSEWAASLKEIIVMGGALAVPGNVTATAEYNFYADPEAARVVVRSGAKLTLVTLDATSQAVLPRRLFDERAERSGKPAARFAQEVCRRYFDFAETRRGAAGCAMHDPLTVGVAVDRSFIRTESFDADVETEGELTAGMLVADRRRPRRLEGFGREVEASVGADGERFIAFFLDRVLGPSGKGEAAGN